MKNIYLSINLNNLLRMKFTLLSGGDSKATRQRTQEVSAFFDYIKEDHNQWLISMFRKDLPRLEHPEYYLRYSKIARVLPAVELRRQEMPTCTRSPMSPASASSARW